jgi:hypothetical protein
MQGAVAFAHYFAGRYEEALWWADKAVREQPLWLSGLVIVAASKAMSGQLDDAQRAAKLACLRDASFCVAEIEARMPLRRSSVLARLAEGLRKAGRRER